MKLPLHLVQETLAVISLLSHKHIWEQPSKCSRLAALRVPGSTTFKRPELLTTHLTSAGEVFL